MSAVRDIGQFGELIYWRLWPIQVFILGGGLAVQQAPLVDGVALDPFFYVQDGVAASEVDVGRREIAETFVLAPVIVVVDKSVELRLQVARQKVECCQTKANRSQVSGGRWNSGCAELPPFFESGGSVELEYVPA